MLAARRTPEADAIGYELAMGGYPEPIRQVPVTGTWAYLDRLEASPGTGISVHVSAEAAHEIEFVRLGLKAVIDPGQSLAEDCADAERIAVVNVAAASPQTITPGSYAWFEGEPLPPGTLCLGLWLRLWKVPVIDVVQVGWQALITDIDYPSAARFGLIVDHLGRIGVYLGDGGVFRLFDSHIVRKAGLLPLQLAIASNALPFLTTRASGTASGSWTLTETSLRSPSRGRPIARTPGSPPPSSRSSASIAPAISGLGVSRVRLKATSGRRAVTSVAPAVG